MDYNYLAKIIVIGDPLVGKSSFSATVSGKEYVSDYAMTIGVDFYSLKKNTKNNKWKVYLWDTAGQENFKSITKVYYRDSAICILMFDVSKRSTFYSLEKWYDDIINETQSKSYFVLIGNKIDIKDRKVSKKEAVEWAHNKNMMYFETSVKNKLNCDVIETILLDFENKNPDLKNTIGIKENEYKLPKTINKRLCSENFDKELDKCCTII